jgi:hypothetical protein
MCLFNIYFIPYMQEWLYMDLDVLRAAALKEKEMLIEK